MASLPPDTGNTVRDIGADSLADREGGLRVLIATMYSYGMDDDCVGVDGIRGCMGVFVGYRPVFCK